MRERSTILICVLFLGTVSAGIALAKDNQGKYTDKLSTTCPEVVADFEQSNLETSETGQIRYKAKFGDVIGWIAGYMTRVNYSAEGKKDHFKRIGDEVRWVVDWCEGHASKNLSDAMLALTKLRLQPR